MLMYSRTEGIFIILLFAFYLLITSKWKYIPFIRFSFIIYSFIGKLVVGKDFYGFLRKTHTKQQVFTVMDPGIIFSNAMTIFFITTSDSNVFRNCIINFCNLQKQGSLQGKH